MLIATDNNNVKYAGCFFLASGIYPNVPQGVAWNGNNIGGSLKRGVGIASKPFTLPNPTQPNPPPPAGLDQALSYNVHTCLEAIQADLPYRVDEICQEYS